MNASDMLKQQGHRLLQVGALFLLTGLVVGLAAPAFAEPRLGLSAHVIGVAQGLMLMLLGLVWPKLKLSVGQGRLAFGLAVYASLAALLASLFIAITGVGANLLMLAEVEGTPASAMQEHMLMAVFVTAAFAEIATAVLILIGLRSEMPERSASC